ncbi:heme ABC exporter ATP-binding protein CcmA [Oceanicola sp. 502str15]|uniref:heme ABC exporter ATP-binding protein CcmA n=1 Tax=Oceanicola sp. 502str15 TaxID=2696061 RepID=UPI00209483F2|nr:heme ABC exporter ATP-binding protein CcmA [Oceanicola sp. 502str15]MCO6382274.1 heme ABC exporter ATP-binding protein CcmA [Oceanicola sp. 502str15]
MSLLSAEDLCVARGGVPVLEGLTFDVGPGEVLVLRGPNGVGKTSLLRVLAGLAPPVAGRVESEGAGYAAHADGLKAMLSVRENLEFWADLHGAGIGDALERMNLAALAERAAGSLSAGQKRRLGLARLLVTGRALWLLDEPTVSLDAASVQLFAGVVRAHLAGGGAAVIATHVALGLEEARVLELEAYRAVARAAPGGFDEAFL